MACHYFSVPAKSLVAAQMHKMVFRHVSLLCTLGAVGAAAAVLRMFRGAAQIALRVLCYVFLVGGNPRRQDRRTP